MEETMSAITVAPEVESVKTRLKDIWIGGEHDRFSRYMEGSTRDVYERLAVAPGCRLMDVGCGSGQLAAKDGLEVTGGKPIQRRYPLSTEDTGVSLGLLTQRVTVYQGRAS
jgi:hypothetical protein